MSLFKKKSDKVFSPDNKFSLYSKHQQFIIHMTKLKDNVSNYKKDIDNLNTKSNEIIEKLNSFDNDTFSPNYHDLMIELGNITNEMHKIEKNVYKIENDININTYYLDLANIYFKFDTTDTQQEIKNIDNEYMNNFVTITKEANNEKILDVWLHKNSHHLDDDSIDLHVQSYNNDIYDICNSCGSRNNFDIYNGMRVCKNCATQEIIITELNKPSYKDKSSDKLYPFSYKKLNHYNEWINHIQGLEITKIPDDVFKNLLLEIKKDRIIDTSQITQKKIRSYLSKLKLSKYYEHVPYITAQLGGEKPPKIPLEVKETLKTMFIEISAPFIKYCPKNRRNFPRYTYMIYKCCELLGYNDILQYLPLLKTRNRLIEMDNIWKSVCKLKGWKFISTV